MPPFSRLHQASSGAVVGPSVYRAQPEVQAKAPSGFDFHLGKARCTLEPQGVFCLCSLNLQVGWASLAG